MSNMLDNGSVLPFGLLSQDTYSMADAFKKTHQNYALRVGIVINSYGKSDPSNMSKQNPEYDVMTFEQNEDQGSTTITYKNCVAASAFGSIADFFEATVRKMKAKTTKGSTPDPAGQNGSMVLLLCLNGLSDRAVIIGALGHPDRKTTLVDDSPRLEGEYNGINIKVETDGSTTLTFKGATDNDGKLIDSKQTPTILKIEKDGSFQASHQTITHRLDKNGKASLTADDDISLLTKKNVNVTTTESINLTATKDFTLASVQLLAKASGSAMLECQKLTIKAESEISVKGSQFKVEAESMAMIKASTITLDGNVALGGAGGQPVLIMSTMMLGVGNLGIPLISQAISGFATKVTAT